MERANTRDVRAKRVAADARAIARSAIDGWMDGSRICSGLTLVFDVGIAFARKLVRMLMPGTWRTAVDNANRTKLPHSVVGAGYSLCSHDFVSPCPRTGLILSSIRAERARNRSYWIYEKR